MQAKEATRALAKPVKLCYQFRALAALLLGRTRAQIYAGLGTCAPTGRAQRGKLLIHGRALSYVFYMIMTSLRNLRVRVNVRVCILHL